MYIEPILLYALAVAFVTFVEPTPPSWLATSLEQGSEIWQLYFLLLSFSILLQILSLRGGGVWFDERWVGSKLLPWTKEVYNFIISISKHGPKSFRSRHLYIQEQTTMLCIGNWISRSRRNHFLKWISLGQTNLWINIDEKVEAGK